MADPDSESKTTSPTTTAPSNQTAPSRAVPLLTESVHVPVTQIVQTQGPEKLPKGLFASSLKKE
jgi:hypothetical protein